MTFAAKRPWVSLPLQAKDAEGKLEAQAKKTQDAGVKADAAREALKASTTAAAAVEAQLAALQARPYRPCSIALLYVCWCYRS